MAILRVQEQRDSHKDKRSTRANLRRPQAVTSWTLRAAFPEFTVRLPWRKQDAAAKRADDLSLYMERAEEALKAAEFKQCS